MAPCYKYKGGWRIEHTHTPHTPLLSCIPCIVLRLSGVSEKSRSHRVAGVARESGMGSSVVLSCNIRLFVIELVSVSRPGGPGSQLVNAACFLVPDDDARGNHNNARFILVPATGPYVQQRGCARALYYLAPEVLVVGDTSEAREGEKLPSLC